MKRLASCFVLSAFLATVPALPRPQDTRAQTIEKKTKVAAAKKTKVAAAKTKKIKAAATKATKAHAEPDTSKAAPKQ